MENVDFADDDIKRDIKIYKCLKSRNPFEYAQQRLVEECTACVIERKSIGIKQNFICLFRVKPTKNPTKTKKPEIILLLYTCRSLVHLAFAMTKVVVNVCFTRPIYYLRVFCNFFCLHLSCPSTHLRVFNLLCMSSIGFVVVVRTFPQNVQVWHNS